MVSIDAHSIAPVGSTVSKLLMTMDERSKLSVRCQNHHITRSANGEAMKRSLETVSIFNYIQLATNIVIRSTASYTDTKDFRMRIWEKMASTRFNIEANSHGN
jgi:hypothetical protein